MDKRTQFLVGTAAGVALGGVTWLLLRGRGEEAAAPALPLNLGEALPAFTGATLSGRSLTLPNDVAGTVTALVTAWDYAARGEVTAWAQQIGTEYGDHPDFTWFNVAFISGIGPLAGKLIDLAMLRGTSLQEREHVLTVYGDLRTLRQRLASPPAQAQVLLLGRTGRVVWRTDGEPNQEALAAFRAALSTQGVAE
jgi:hypothetical protein